MRKNINIKKCMLNDNNFNFNFNSYNIYYRNIEGRRALSFYKYNNIYSLNVIKCLISFFFFFFLTLLFIYFFQFEIILWWYPDIVVTQIKTVLDTSTFLEEPVNYLVFDGYLIRNDKFYMPNELLYIIYSLYKYKKYIHKLQYMYNYNDFILSFLSLDRYADKYTGNVPVYNDNNRRKPSGFFIFLYSDQHRYDRDYEVNRLQLWFKWFRKVFKNLEIDEDRWGYFKIGKVFNTKLFYYDNFFKKNYLKMLEKYEEILKNNIFDFDLYGKYKDFNQMFYIKKLYEYFYNRKFDIYYTKYPNYKFNRQNRVFGWGVYDLDLEWDSGYDRYYFTTRRVKPYGVVPVFSKSFYYSNNLLRDLSPLVNFDLYDLLVKINTNVMFENIKVVYEDLPIYVQMSYDDFFVKKKDYFNGLLKDNEKKKFIVEKPLKLLYIYKLNEIYKKRKKWLLKKMLRKYLYFYKKKNYKFDEQNKILDFLYYGNMYRFYQFYDLLYKLESFFKFENINYFISNYNKFFSWYENYYRTLNKKKIFDDVYDKEYEMRKRAEFMYLNNLNYILFDYLKKINDLNKNNSEKKKNYILLLYKDLNKYIYNNFFKTNIEPYRFKNYFLVPYIYRDNIRKLQRVNNLLYNIIQNNNILFKELFYKNKRFKRFIRSHSLFGRKLTKKYARRFFKYSHTVQPIKYKQVIYPVGFGFNKNRKQKRRKIQLVSYKMPNRFDLLYDEFFLKQKRFNKKFIGFSGIDIEMDTNKFNPIISYRLGDQYDNVSRATFWMNLYTRYKYRVKEYFFYKKNVHNKEFVKIYMKLKLSYFMFLKKFNFFKKIFLNYLKLNNLFYENMFVKPLNDNIIQNYEEKIFNEKYLICIILNFFRVIVFNFFNFFINIIKKFLKICIIKVKLYKNYLIKIEFYRFKLLVNYLKRKLYNNFFYEKIYYYVKSVYFELKYNIYILQFKKFIKDLIYKKFFVPEKIIYVNQDKILNNSGFSKDFVDDFEILNVLDFKDEIKVKKYLSDFIFNNKLSIDDKKKLWKIFSKEIYIYGKERKKLKLLFSKIEKINNKLFNDLVKMKRDSENKKNVLLFRERRDYDLEALPENEQFIMKLKLKFNKYIRNLMLNNMFFKNKLLLRDNFDNFSVLFDTNYLNLYDLKRLNQLKLFYMQKLENKDFKKLKKEQIYEIIKVIDLYYHEIIKNFKNDYYSKLNKYLALKREFLSERIYHHLYPLEQNPEMRDLRVENLKNLVTDKDLLKRRNFPHEIVQARNSNFLNLWMLRKNQYLYNQSYKNYYIYKIPGHWIFFDYINLIKLKYLSLKYKKKYKNKELPIRVYLHRKYHIDLYTIHGFYYSIKRIFLKKTKLKRRLLYRRFVSYIKKLEKYYNFFIYLKYMHENKLIMPYIILDIKYIERLFKTPTVYKYRLILFYTFVVILSYMLMKKINPILDIDSDDYESDILIYIGVCIFLMIHCYINLRGFYLRSGNKVSRRGGVDTFFVY